MLRLHRRAKYIRRIFDTIRKVARRGPKTYVAVMLDRPDVEVTVELDRQLRNLPDSIEAAHFEAPYPLVDDRENFMAALKVHYEYLRGMADVDAASLWDDDMWFDAAGIRELRGHMHILEYDRIEARSYFLWDHLDMANDAFPPHWQAILFRAYEGDDFPENYMVHCPHQTAISQYSCRMHNRLRNAGYLTEEERARSWDMFKRAGKIDGHTMCLIKDPKLVRVNGSKKT